MPKWVSLGHDRHLVAMLKHSLNGASKTKFKVHLELQQNGRVRKYPPFFV
jgi:hypothetical protein